ncbi:MAG: hypothetical protein ACLSWY_00930 [Ruthenibacterium lactatiformans]
MVAVSAAVRDIRRAGRIPCAALELDAALPELMAALDVLAARKTPPADRQELKRVLSRLPEALDYDAAARTGSGGPALEQPARTVRGAAPLP